MTKWSRKRRREERRRAESEEQQISNPQETEFDTQPKNISENIQDARQNSEQKNTQTFKVKSILTQIPRYVYISVFFVLMSGVFHPLITQNPLEQNLNNVISGTVILFLGLAGAILVYKGTTANKNRVVVVSFGFVLIAVSLALIFTIAGTPV